MAAPTLNGQLICASNYAYAIQKDSTLATDSESERYSAGVGFVQPPTPFVGIETRDINACLVGSIPAGVIVAFRGTLPPMAFSLQVVLDWLNDLSAIPVPSAGMPGRVHEGFLHSLDSLWAQIKEETLRQLAEAGAGAELFITGHSKGGGMAPLAAWRFLKEVAIKARVVTFAGAKCGDVPFTEAYNQVIEQDRFEFADDIVPHLPMSAGFLNRIKPPALFVHPFQTVQTFNYEPTGTLRYIRRNLEILDDSPELADERVKSLAHAIGTLHFKQVIDDHRVGCGFGYMSSACPDGVCDPS